MTMKPGSKRSALKVAASRQSPGLRQASLLLMRGIIPGLPGFLRRRKMRRQAVLSQRVHLKKDAKIKKRKKSHW